MGEPPDTSDAAPHSAMYLTDERDGWWNLDYLALVVHRLRLEAAREVLDVGAGRGHFTRLLSRVLDSRCRFIGVEREARWVDDARARSASDPRFAFVEGTAESLPFADARFDLVTCQTVLMHLGEPRRALEEMVRVLKPGGVLLCVEPNNIATNLARLVTQPELDPEALVAFVKLDVLCQRGKYRLGRGFNSLGEILSGELAAVGLADVQASVCDRCQLVGPAYEASGAQSERDELSRYREQDVLIWPREETYQYFLAGGGRPEEFASLWQTANDLWYARLSALAEGRLAYNGGSLLYLVSGRKREAMAARSG